MKQNIKTTTRLLCMILAAIVAVTGFGITPVRAAVTGSSIPTAANYGALKWSLNLGTGYTNAPTPPMVHGDYVYVGMNQTLYKLDKETGKQVTKVTLADSFGFATAALTYAENVNGKNVIFAPISEGVVQAIDADTMKSLWITKTAWDGSVKPNLSCLSRVIYDNGYIYFGTWQTDSTTGYFYCYDATDANPTLPTETKLPTWKVPHTGGFYWSEANVSGQTVVFGSEDGSNGYLTPTKTADIYSCRKGGDFISLGKTSGDSPVIGHTQISGDIRSGVVYDDQTSAYYFTTRPGILYKRTLNADGTFAPSDSTSGQLALGGVTTGTPTVYKGKIYVGVQGATPFGTTGHKIKIIDGQSMSLDATGTTPGFVQSEMILSTAKEGEGKLYLYMTYNQLPGGIYMMEITQDAQGKKIITPGKSYNLFIPPASMQNYGISTLEVDSAGTLYYKNDSCTLMAVKAGYSLESISASGGAITKSTSVLFGGGATFAITPSTGYKIADVKVDGVSKGAKTSYTFTAVTAPHKIQPVFIHTVTPNLTSAVSTGYNSIKLSWTKQVGVSGYEIWRATSSKGTYAKIKTLSATTVSYTNTGLTTGKAYYYRIRNYYKNTAGGIVYSSLSSAAKGAVPKLSTPTLTLASGVDKLKLTWKAIPGATGYRLYKKTSATSAYYRVKTIVGGSVTTWTNTGLTTGKTYYYKIVAYRVVNGKTYLSNYSNVSYRKPY